MNGNYRFFQNTECEYFPCHRDVAEDDFNCLFCYCPLYALGSRCDGGFVFTQDGTKDCSGCRIPHERRGYDYVISKYELIKEMVRKNER